MTRELIIMSNFCYGDSRNSLDSILPRELSRLECDYEHIEITQGLKSWFNLLPGEAAQAHARRRQDER